MNKRSKIVKVEAKNKVEKVQPVMTKPKSRSKKVAAMVDTPKVPLTRWQKVKQWFKSLI